MALQLVSKNRFTFIQNLLSDINSTLEAIDSSSDIEVIFEENPEYTQFKLIDDTLYFKDMLPYLIDLLGVEDGVRTFINRFNNAFYEILTTYDQVIDLDEQFVSYKKTIYKNLFASKDSLHSHILLSLHNDNLIYLDERNYKIVRYQTSIGYFVSYEFKFYTKENKDILSLENMLNTAFTIKSGLEGKDYVYSKPFSSSYSHQEWENLNNIADTSILVNMRMNDKNDELFQIYFTKKQVASSVIQTLLSKFDHIDDDEEVELDEKLNTFIGKLSKDKRRGRYSLSDLLTILSIFYFRYLYIDSKNTNKSKNSQGINSYFATLFNQKELNILKNNSIKYSELLEVAVHKDNLNSDFRQLHNDINDLTKEHLSISYKDYDDLYEESDFSNIVDFDDRLNETANLFIHKLFFMDQIPSTEFLISTLNDIYNHICENINFFHTNAPDEILKLSIQLAESTKEWSESIKDSSLKSTLSQTNLNKYNPFPAIYDLKILNSTHLSLINTMNIINKLNLRKKYFKHH
ncbi:TPA: hypothetical protein ACYIV0_002760 [Staphylococcus aureus]|uniref:Uncharacterized protein n=1 Tax=Mammaliicoccus sciuri TaxID=1296 RepID=A0ABT7HYT1_MAMSC|nr:hypothetical protein [Mammaliicoccus sciuri]MDL0112804.1 hypothetical protein [Mammaliicoccus sciuri]MDL0117309.1 hypothetical protein [Mammaliicoccus sciuri]